MMENQKFNPLVQFFVDQQKDPGKWSDYLYPCTIALGKTAGSVAMGSITLDTFPYILMGLSGKIEGDVSNPTTSGIYQDGMWQIEFKESKRNFSKGYIPADLFFGNPAYGYYRNLPYPIAFDGGQVLSFNLRNMVNRPIPAPQDTFNIVIVAHGIGFFGS